MSKDKDLVSRVVKQLEADRKRAEAANQRLAEEQEIKKDQAPVIWQALGQWMKKLCEDCNAQERANQLEFKASESYEFDVVKRVPPHVDTLHVVFNPRAHTITYQRKPSSGNWTKITDRTLDELIKGRANGTFYPKFDGKEFGYTLDDATAIMTVEQMGKQLINAALLL